MVLAHISRDQDTLDESAIWKGFREGRKSETKIEALIYVPTRIVMGISKSSSGCEMPFTVLMKNDWTKFAHSKELYEICVTRRSAPFANYSNNTEKALSGQVNGSFCRTPVTAYCITLSEPVSLSGSTKIIF